LAICHLGVACFQITVAGPHAIFNRSLQGKYPQLDTGYS
jgi:hypothetical protein